MEVLHEAVIQPPTTAAAASPFASVGATVFESIVSKISNTFRNAVRALGAATRTAPFVTAAAILALFLLV